MIHEIRADVVNQILRPELATGKLRDFTHVQEGDENVRTELHPALTWEYDNHSSLVYTGNRFEWKLRYVATIYSSSLLTVQEGASEHLRLLCRPDGNELVGMMPALAKLSVSGFRANSGQKFSIRLDEATKSWAIKGKNHLHWSFATEARVWFETWLNPSQMI